MTVMTPAVRAEMLNTISDLSKDAYGYRLRFDYAAMSDQELQSTWDSFMADADREIARENEAFARSEKEFDKRIQDYIAMGAGNRTTAIRWDIEASGHGKITWGEDDFSYDLDEYKYYVGLRGSFDLGVTTRDLHA